jgi:HEAT repeat protein
MDLSAYIASLSADEAATRARAAEALARLGEDARGAAVPLVRAAGDEDEQVREWATAALEELGSPARDDVAAMMELIDNRQADIGYWAVTLLGRAERAAATAVPQLAAALTSSLHPTVQHRAAWALGQIGIADGARPALEKAAKSDDVRLARLAEKALTQL